MPRNISIAATPLLKFVASPVWLVGAGYVMWVLWNSRAGILADYEPATAVAIRVVLTLLLAASVLLAFRFVIPLKRVQVAEDGLRISNFRREVVIPFTEIAGAQQHWLPTFRLVTLRFKNDTPFGRRIVFMPSVSIRTAFWRSSYWQEDDLVRELRAVAGLPAGAITN